MKVNTKREIWKISASEKVTKKPEFVDIFLENNFIASGEYGEGDLTKYDSFERLESKLTELRKTTHSTPTTTYYTNFKDNAEIGDIVLIYSRNTIFGIGYISSEYYYEQDELGKNLYSLGIPHRRKVKWIIRDEIEDEKFKILSYPQVTFYKLDEKQKKAVLKILANKSLIE